MFAQHEAVRGRRFHAAASGLVGLKKHIDWQRHKFIANGGAMQRQSEGLMYMHSHTPTNFARVLCVLVTRGASGGRSCIVGACMRVCALLQLQAPTADLVQRDTNDSTGTWAGGEGSEGSLPRALTDLMGGLMHRLSGCCCRHCMRVRVCVKACSRLFAACAPDTRAHVCLCLCVFVCACGSRCGGLRVLV